MKCIARFSVFVVFLTLTAILTDSAAAKTVTWNCPETDGIKGLPDKAPTREEYLSLLKEVNGHYAKKLSPAARSEIDSILAKASTPVEAADAGAALMLKGAGSASVYSVSKGALNAPEDIITANNLGVALEGMYDVKRALRALLYAKGARPQSALVEINIAYLYFNIGDMKAAKEHFKKAESLDPAAHSNLGLGLIAYCEDRYPDAIRYLSASGYETSSEIGDAVLKKAKRAQKKSDKEEEAADGEVAHKALSTWPQNLERDEGAANDIKFPDIPLLTGDIERDATLANAYIKLNGELDVRLAAVTTEIAASSGMNFSQPRRESADSGELHFNFKRETSLLRELLGVHDGKAHLALASVKLKGASLHKVEPVLEDFIKSMNNDIRNYTEAMGDKYGELSCKELHKGAKEDYDDSYKIWRSLNDSIVPDTENYMAYSNPLLEKIYDKEKNALENRKREFNLLSDYYVVTGMGMRATVYASLHYATTDCETQKKPVQGPNAKDPFDIKNQDPNCPFDTSVKLGFPKGVALASIQLSCSKAKLEIGTGLIGSLERDFKQRETTVFVGVGANTDASMLGAGAKAGFSMTTNSFNELKDVAVETSASVKTGVFENEVTARLGFESGPSLSHETALAF